MNILQGLKSAGGSRAGAAFALSIALAALFTSGAAVATTENNYKYTKARPGWVGISNLGMVPNKNIGNYDNSASGTGLATDSFRCFSRGINLPQGAIIKNLTVFHAAFTEAAVGTTLVRQRIGGTIGRETLTDTIGTRTSTTTSALRVSYNVPIDANFAVVDNAHYTYGFNICLDANATFFNARLGYTYTSAGD